MVGDCTRRPSPRRWPISGRKRAISDQPDPQRSATAPAAFPSEVSRCPDPAPHWPCWPASRSCWPCSPRRSPSTTRRRRRLSSLVRGAPRAEPVGHLVVSEVVTERYQCLDELIGAVQPIVVGPAAGGPGGYLRHRHRRHHHPQGILGGGRPVLPAGAHVLIANGAGAFAGIADVDLHEWPGTGRQRGDPILGAATAIDAVGWGTAASTWMEGARRRRWRPGHAIERLPGGAWGSGQDTDQNDADFVERTARIPRTWPRRRWWCRRRLPTASPTAADTPGITPTLTGTPRHTRANASGQPDTGRDAAGHANRRDPERRAGPPRHRPPRRRWRSRCPCPARTAHRCWWRA